MIKLYKKLFTLAMRANQPKLGIFFKRLYEREEVKRKLEIAKFTCG